MHTLWKGAISFGMVHIPVKMHTATEDKDISLCQIHKDCGSHISYVKICPICEKEVEMESIVKGFEYEKGKYVFFEKDELEQLFHDSSKEIKIMDFINLNEIDPIYFQKTYYLSPGDTGANAYNLLLEALRSTGKIGICKVSIRSKSSLAAIRVLESCIVLETIYYPDEIRPVHQVPNLSPSIVNETELQMAQLLIQHLSSNFEPAKYRDEYRHELMGLIQKKIAGEEIHMAPAQNQSTILDLMAALQASLVAYQSTPDKKNITKKSKASKTKTKSDIEVTA